MASKEDQGSARSLPRASPNGRTEAASSVARWTPGPWQVSGGRQRETLYGHGVGPDEGPLIAMVPYSDFTVEEHIASLADAQLIAAAPDLYEALAFFVGQREAFAGGNQADAYNAFVKGKDAQWDRARAALAKAEGRS